MAAIFIELALLLALRAEIRADGYSRRVWQTQNGLPQDTINALEQTSDGYLWIGTSGGLVRFDGFRFTVFDRENTPALREESVYSLYCTRDGTLWIGTEGGGLVRYHAGTFRRFAASDGLTNGFVRVIFEDHRTNLWIGTDRGLFRFDAGKLTRVDNQTGIPSMSVHAMHEDSKRRLWVGGSGLVVLSDGAAAVYRSSRSRADDSVRDIAESDDGTIWVATIGGLHRVPGGNPSNVFSSNIIIPHNTSLLYRAKDGHLWAGTYGLGLFRYATGEPAVYRAPAVLPDNYILALLEDREGNVWVGTQNGLLRLSRSVVSTVATGLPGAPESIRTIYEDRNRRIWLTTLSGRLYCLDGSKAVPAALPAGLTTLKVRTVFRDSTGVLWIGTEGEGAANVSSSGVVQYTMKQGLINDFVRAFCESRDGSLWIGTDSGLSRWRQGTFQNYHTAEGLAYGSIRALLEDRTGDLWVATDGGVNRLHDGATIRDPSLDALAGEKIWAMHEDPDGGLWFGTRGAGLFLLQDAKLTGFTTKHGIPNNSIHQIFEDRTGNLWMGGPSGIFSVNRRDLKQILSQPHYRPAISLYGTSEGMETNQINGGVQPAGTIRADGEIWFPSTRGAVRITPDPSVRTSVPPVLVEQVVAEGQDVPLKDMIDVGPGEGRLEIGYTAVRLRSSERIRFRYRLEGFDSDWTEAGGRRVAYYTNLPPGSYRFRVAAYEVDDPRYASEAALGIRLRPHFYETAWFAALCAAVLAGAGLAAYRLHVGQIHARFAAVLAERNRLAREMHDTLIQGCVGVSTLLDAAVSLQTSSPDLTKDLLERAQTQVRTSVDEARRAVWNLRHEAAEGEGLVSALERLAQQVALASGVRIDYETVGKPVPLDAQVEHDLVMIAKEAVLNAVHHGRPESVLLSGSFESTRLQVRVSDNGCGFEPSVETSKPGEHYGLVGMSERAKQMGGTFTLDSQPGQGTHVSVTVPIRPHVARR
ncbi:MAG TPA: two-component regulator propeller domain-containing protein [Terriglobia bacterium]|nr:two-component regulator propeller domain-containing protein [Terriglobia bacterium]